MNKFDIIFYTICILLAIVVSIIVVVKKVSITNTEITNTEEKYIDKIFPLTEDELQEIAELLLANAKKSVSYRLKDKDDKLIIISVSRLEINKEN